MKKKDNLIKLITKNEVINGLKFIAEHQYMDQDELFDNLVDLGCTFISDDIKVQYPSNLKVFEGMKEGNLGSGAAVIINVRDSLYGRQYCTDRFLSIDDETSIYNFIRITTGDKSYTKELVDKLNILNEKESNKLLKKRR